MKVDPIVLAYVRVVVTMDSITSELAPSLDVVKHQLRFFSAMTLDEVHNSLRPAELVNTVMEYRYRIDRALDFADRVITEERAVGDILGTARTWIERLAYAGVLGVIAVWLVERFTGHTRGVFNTNADSFLSWSPGSLLSRCCARRASFRTHDPEDGGGGGRSGDRQLMRATVGSRSRPSRPSRKGLGVANRSGPTQRRHHEKSASQSPATSEPAGFAAL